MKFGKVACFVVLGLTGCGADDGGRETPAAVTPEGEGGNGGDCQGGSGAVGEGGSGGSAGSSAAGTSGAGGGTDGSGGSAGSSGGTSGTGGTGQPLEPDVATAVANIDVNLERLRALRVVEVKSLIPEHSGEAMGRAALRLQKLASVAEIAVKNDYVAASCIDRVDVNLAALSGLQIVELGAFLRSAPANNPLCDNTPCPSDIEATAVENEARAADLESIAIAAKPL